ncbi:CoA transferase [Aquincola sp. S2]|uniref:CoA transferase n=1 Tax=Pseudaquabacterium terrae TaxID=2732868 RepID=A0ABX2EGD8_9BURK|nr:CaiB/BaiF CoA-transferase family protein [Aquabacterium terrae]NRF67684.1 CoA transferase [Aquabacterium terrae]
MPTFRSTEPGPRAARPPEPQGAPLAGVRILDLTRLLPGPVCTQHLADLGADVVKIEDLGAGDAVPPKLRALLHRNKRGIRLDLKHADGAAALLQLARTADVLIEGFRPGVMARLGLDHAAVSAVNPRLVYCSITGYGQHGPDRDRPGHDLNYCAEAGVADQIGTVHGPALSNVPIADLIGGALGAAMGILAALVDAQRSGRGRHVDIAMADGALAHAVMPLAALATSGRTRRAGTDTLTGGLACYATYRTADDRWLAVGALERKFWDALCDAVKRPDWKPLHRSGRRETEELLRGELAALFASRTLAEWDVQLRHAGCCVSPLRTLEEALADAQFRAREMVFESVHPSYGPVTQVALPVRMSGHQFAIHRHAPRPGEHTAEVLREAGYDDAAIDALMTRGAAAAAS